MCDFTGTVCPTCRGAHWLVTKRPDFGVSTQGACPDCMKPLMRDGEQVWDEVLKRHRWIRDEEGEVAAIRRYRARVAAGTERRELVAAGVGDTDDLPF